MNWPDPGTMTSGGARVQAALALHKYLNSCVSSEEICIPHSSGHIPEDISLPAARRSNVSFWEAAENRRSRYQCDLAAFFDLSDLSALLRAIDLCPSAGGLRSTYPYVLIPRAHVISDFRIESGVFKYCNDPSPCLIGKRAASESDIRKGIIQIEFVDRFPAFIVLVANLKIMFDKYSIKNYQMVFADAGVILQNLHLACETVGLVGCPIGGLNTSVMHDLLQLSTAEVVTMAFAFGTASGR